MSKTDTTEALLNKISTATRAAVEAEVNKANEKLLTEIRATFADISLRQTELATQMAAMERALAGAKKAPKAAKPEEGEESAAPAQPAAPARKKFHANTLAYTKDRITDAEFCERYLTAEIRENAQVEVKKKKTETSKNTALATFLHNTLMQAADQAKFKQLTAEYAAAKEAHEKGANGAQQTTEETGDDELADALKA